MDLLTPASLRTLLAAHGLRASRALGQHFLADPNTARRIVRLAGVASGGRVLEIGPGAGSLTLALVEAGAAVLALELDRHVVPVLVAACAARGVACEVVPAGAAPGPPVRAGAVSIVVGDALRADYPALLGDPEPPWSVVANLPYNVATPLVVRLLETAPAITRLTVMVQAEVGRRFAAGPGTKAYGAVSLKIRYHAAAKVLGNVPPTVFFPPPKVDSVVVALERRPVPPVAVPSEAALFTLVRAGFAHRRQTLHRTLEPVLGGRTDAVLADAGVPPSARAEALSLEQWAAVARVAA